MTKVHFLGIAGSGASAVASIAKAYGFEVTGCDKVSPQEFANNFSSHTLQIGHDPAHLAGVEILAVTPAIFSTDPNNPELQEAKKRGIEIMTWQEFMGKYLEKDKFVIAVCGTHGKSTTTAMTGLLAESAGLDPTVELGANVPSWQGNFRVGNGQYFITEADEFNDNFLVSNPNITIITTLEMDHPEYFQDFTAYKMSFRKFLSQTTDLVIANLSDPGVRDVVTSTFNMQTGKNIEIIDYSEKLIDFPLQVPGQFNILNASAAAQVGVALGINPEIIQKSLAAYTGSERRFEYLGEYLGGKVYSDFGHHPTEIKVTLQALREKYPTENITVVFQPHMFSRTKALFPDFVATLETAPVDKIIIMDIYPSREVDTGLINSFQLVQAIDKKSVIHIATAEEVLAALQEQQTDIIFFLGAGITHELAQKLLS